MTPMARRRAMWGSALWLAAAMPYYATLAMFLRDGSGYAAHAVVSGSWLGTAGSARGARPLELHAVGVGVLASRVVRAAAVRDRVRDAPLRRWRRALSSRAGRSCAWRAGRRPPWAPRSRLSAAPWSFLALSCSRTRPTPPCTSRSFAIGRELMSRVWASLAVAVAVRVPAGRARRCGRGGRAPRSC